jgi:conjugative transfer signal peptidase TraF
MKRVEDAGTSASTDHAPHPRAGTGKTGFRQRAMLAVVSLFLLVTLLSTSLWPPRPVLVWNASPSSTIGLYRVRAPARLRKGEMLVAFAPMPARRLAAKRGYLPFNVPLVKSLAGVAGDRVCVRGADVFVNDKFAARRLAKDLSGRPLPSWQGCRTLLRGEEFLLSRSVPRAFDGRYFGITREKEVVGEAILLWAQ